MVQHAVSIEHSSIRISRSERARRAWLAERRKYNRLYMRAWRAQPANSAAERRNRARWHYERKLREALRRDLHVTKRAEPVCGFCRKLAPVTQIWRLEIRDLAPRGYVEVRVPYCGEC
jgi:hypothetical protein